MDPVTSPHDGRPGADIVPAAGMPHEQPADMPAQSLTRFARGDRRPFADRERSRGQASRRIVVFGTALVLAVVATYEMVQVLKVGGLTHLEYAIIVLFSLNFGWIAFAFVGSLAGFAVLLHRRRAPVPRLEGPVKGRTAVLMPIYNEDPDRVFAAVEAMSSGVAALKAGAFDWFLLSDTTDPDVVMAEERAFVALRARLGESAPVYYRRRRRNIGRKAANIADFCRRWGGAYDYLLVLDADSLMAPAAIVELARRMDADPDAGIIQTVPRLTNGRSVLARLQQFAGRAYGPIIAAGVGWWSGAEGNYWGHNAIIRREAFTRAAGLPTLSGPPPFGGHILSHDFVEAALIRRAGWSVRLADDIGESFEESPPSLIDLAARDRRWCQGNLQHARIIGARGLNWVSRFHLLTGIMSYVASPLWLLLTLAGLGLALQAQFLRPEYFTEAFQLHPIWPAIDPIRALRLLVITGVVLFGPKLLGFLLLLTDRAARGQSGGGLRLTGSFLVENVVSALIAPIMMVLQTGIVLSIFLGFDSGWKAQRRDDGHMSWGELAHRHRWHELSGVLLAIAAFLVSPAMLAWLSPAVAGLVLAVPLSALTGSRAVGDFVRRRGLLATPEETVEPEVGRIARAARPEYARSFAGPLGLALLVRDDRLRRTHLALVDRVPERPLGAVDPVEAVASAKIAEGRSLDEAVSFLSKEESAAVLAAPKLFERLVALLPAHERDRSAA
jgi:membrane glycosyltransferase